MGMTLGFYCHFDQFDASLQNKSILFFFEEAFLLIPNFWTVVYIRFRHSSIKSKVQKWTQMEMQNKYIHELQSWPKISAPSVNIIKKGCEN